MSYWVERNTNRCDLDIIIFDSLSKRNYVKMNYKRCVNCPIGWNGMPTDAAKFPHSSIPHYAYSLLLEENNSENNRLPLGLSALFSRS